MNFTVENLEFFLLILVRMSAFIFTAPFFSLPNIPRKIKVLFSVFLAVILFQTLKYTPLEYNGVLGLATLIIQELIIGILMGYMTNICVYILNFSGQLIDTEIGFAMVNVMNPISNMTTTITGNLYTYFVLLVLVSGNIHHYILKAVVDAFQIIPVGQVAYNSNMYFLMVRFMTDYFVIGFRIVLPIFASILIVNIVLGILAKVAPQMNMFVIGIQLKIFVGLIILFIVMQMIPDVANFIYDEMKTMMRLIVEGLKP